MMTKNKNTAEFHPGQLLMVDIEGMELDDDTAHFLRENHIRAICLFRKNMGSEAKIRKLTADLRAVMGPLSLIAIDQEGGPVIRCTSLPQPPAAMALGAINDPGTAERVGAAVARGLRYLGINWNFAPVLDINNNPTNPVIAERSFGEDADRVIRLAGAWMNGSLKEGVACCVKHFPGHGDTHMDSHHALPSVNKSMAQLEALELRPFRALAATAPAMMTAHIVYPQIDPGHPATLSRPFLTGILRGAIGYSGVVITDALMMKAVHDRYGHARAALLTLQAGADMPLAQGNRQEQIAALAGIADGIKAGSLLIDDLYAARDRLDALALRYPATATEYAAVQRAQDDALMRDTWARGLTALRSPQPPLRTAALRVITQGNVISDGVSEAGLSAADVRDLFQHWTDVDFVEVSDLLHLDWTELPVDGRTTILVSNIRRRYGTHATAWRPDLHLILWNPFQAMDVAAPALISWGYSTGALEAVRHWLEGNAPAPGIAPVTLGIRSSQ